MFDVRDDQIINRRLIVMHRLRCRRVQLGLTQREVARQLSERGMGMTDKSLSGLEHGTGLDVDRLMELVAPLDCTITYLLGLTDDPHRWDPDSSLLATNDQRPVPETPS